jgi:F-type H+-transporting ATPase subunit a
MQAHHESIVTSMAGSLGLHAPDEIVGVTFVAGLLVVLAVVGGRRLSVERPGRLQQVLEVGLSGFVGLMEDTIPHHARRYLPMIGTFAFFILACNLCGLIPGLQPPTQSVNVTVGLAVMSFTYYNVQGLRAVGPVGYMKHFLGPMLALAPLMLPLEIVAHVARNLSLSMRQFGNIFGDNTASGVFQTFLGGYLVPLPMMALGLLGSFLQAFIFVVLTMVYVAMATEHH